MITRLKVKVSEMQSSYFSERDERKASKIMEEIISELVSQVKRVGSDIDY